MLKIALILDVNQQPVGFKCKQDDCDFIAVILPDTEIRQFLSAVALHLRDSHKDMLGTAQEMVLTMHMSKDIMAIEMKQKVNDLPFSAN